VDWKLELVAVPVSDVDRAKSFYVDMVGFIADHDHKVNDELRFVQLTPPGSACSIAFGKGIVDTPPGSVAGLQLVVEDIHQARRELLERGDTSCFSATPTATAGRCSSCPSATEVACGARYSAFRCRSDPRLDRAQTGQSGGCALASS
jgi:catechol 2,3-dioxygenase-like lactoylglutathione lyase family enzyme